MFRISGFYDEVSSDLNKQIETAKSLGGKFICPRSVDGKNIADYTAEEFEAQILPRLKEAEICISSLGSPIGKIALDDDAAYDGQMKKLEELVKIAKLAGCKFIRCFSFFMPKGVVYADAKPKVVEKLRGFLQLVEGTDIIILHENEKKIYGDIPERVSELYKEINHPNFKLCYDASNYIQCGADPHKAYEDTKQFTAYYHMKDCKEGIEVPLGTGQGRIKEVVADLVESGYDGFLTLEPHTLKYALLKLPLYIIPFGIFSKPAKVYRKIDKDMGVKALQNVGRDTVFKWQFDNLVKIIEEVGGQYE